MLRMEVTFTLGKNSMVEFRRYVGGDMSSNTLQQRQRISKFKQRLYQFMRTDAPLLVIWKEAGKKREKKAAMIPAEIRDREGEVVFKCGTVVKLADIIDVQ